MTNEYMSIGGRPFLRRGKTYIMGILNMTPDSFSDGGSYGNLKAALRRVEQMIREGAHIIDVGGESTRPGHTRISDAEEIERIVPVIRAIKERFKVPVSVDTYKSAVAKAAILAGADMVNDIWGLKYDPHMAQVIAQHGVACCLMHNQDTQIYEDFLSDVLHSLEQSVEIALEAGIDKDRIILDPGVGFGKDVSQNLFVLKHLSDFRKLGYPILLGTSRKSVIGNVLNLPANARVFGTAATSVRAVEAGCSFIRVHDIRENYEAVKMAEAMCYAPEPLGGREPQVWHRVYLGLGSNMGDRHSYMKEALNALDAPEDVVLVQCSHFLETKPYGSVVQEDFLNACVCIKTKKTPRELLEFLNAIEARLGRERIVRWGPRTIDLDILLYDDWVVDEEDLKIPHVDMGNREFVLRPLAEIAGHVIHPVFKKTVFELYDDLFKGGALI